MLKPTPHIEITNPDDLAKTVLMPGDPLRAKYIAENFLTDVKQVNSVRGMFAYTGYYKKKRITVFASGMGQPSVGIYSYELFHNYGVDNIIRIGSAGSYSPDLKLFDTILVKKAYSESIYAKVAYGYKSHTLAPSKEINRKLKKAAKKLKIELKEGNCHSSDVFYHDPKAFDWKEFSEKHNVQCVEMESFALFANAIYTGKNAACLLTISDSFITKEETTSEQRQKSLTNMIKVALEFALYE